MWYCNKRISKRRTWIFNNRRRIAYLEIEFTDTKSAENYKMPDWEIKDVTTDLNYKNGYLARYGIPDSFFEYIK